MLAAQVQTRPLYAAAFAFALRNARGGSEGGGNEGKDWWAVLGSNQWLPPCEGGTLPLS
jgi:hypothetical protein